MSSYSNYGKKNNNKGLKAFAIIVTILLVAALVVGLLFIGRTTNGFKEIPDFDDEVDIDESGDGDDGTEDGVYVPGDDDSDDDSGDSSALSATLTMSLILSDDYDRYGVASGASCAYVIDVEITPSNADIKDYSWSLTLDTDYSGYSDSMIKDGNGNDWMSPSSVVMDDYMVLTNEGLRSVTLSCFAPFGCTIDLVYSISDLAGNNFTRVCTLDYRSYSRQYFDFCLGTSAISSSVLFSFDYNYDSQSFELTSDVSSAFPVSMESVIEDGYGVYVINHGLEVSVGSLPSVYASGMSIVCEYTHENEDYVVLTYDVFTSFSDILTSLGFENPSYADFLGYDETTPFLSFYFKLVDDVMNYTCDDLVVDFYFTNAEVLIIPITDVTLSESSIVFG